MYTARNFNHLFGTVGFSDNLLTAHFSLYEGYVKNINILTNRLQELLKENKTVPGEYAELKRRFGWEYNGMRLHELYFENIINGGAKIKVDSKLNDLIKKSFSSFENWKKDFVGTGALRGIGWAILAYDKKTDNLFNIWINEHDVGLLADTVPLLVMDVFEHAFMLDYGIKRADYIESFMQAIDWNKVEERL